MNEAIKLKNKGNELFRKKNYEEALKLYTQAIQLCPPDKRKEMSTFYQNRAACYEHMKQFEQVIHDSTKAIENDKRYVKAYLRRGKGSIHHQSIFFSSINRWSSFSFFQLLHNSDFHVSENKY